MKRWMCLAALLLVMGNTGSAQSGRTAKFLADGLFFAEKPEMENQSYQMSILKNGEGQMMLFLAGVKLSEEARRYALPQEEVPDADEWLEKAKTLTDFLQIREISAAEQALKAGDRIKAFEVTDTEGRIWTDQSAKGAPLVLNFWYTGCGPCIREMPELSTWVDACPGVNFLAVTWNTADQIKTIVEKQGFRFVQIAGDTALWKMFGVQQTPTTVVIDAEGVVRKIVMGTNQQKRDELLACIEGLITEEVK